MKTLIGSPEWPHRWSGERRSMMARIRMALEQSRRLR